jgi:hypothetical protein
VQTHWFWRRKKPSSNHQVEQAIGDEHDFADAVAVDEATHIVILERRDARVVL